MLDGHALTPLPNDLDDIEAVSVIRPAVPLTPDLGNSADRLALLPADRFPASTVSQAPAGLHLHERDQRTTADDQVDFISANPKAMRRDLPAFRCEESRRLLLAVVTEAVPRIAPVTRGMRAGGAMAARIADGCRMCGTCGRSGGQEKRGR